MKNLNEQTRLMMHPMDALQRKYNRLLASGEMTERQEEMVMRRMVQLRRQTTHRHKKLLQKPKYMPAGPRKNTAS